MNLMILGGAKAPPAPGGEGDGKDGAEASCAARAELEARLARIEACLEALERALLPGRAAKKMLADGQPRRTTKRKETSHGIA
ncbi:hypothetical protein NNJEOMEG_03866 [Fundidesulfovibrio magnetotacticus]|uniref:Uncharacterized protein n=1 Tax=Fundidesulfovibrio magnetotacticus TaxID=2730080 RepID=A0A6V8LU44_9BACT|nr:hypothetical protein [Fundidesulfovibrio magnetotacticus]GFK95992.1 hypothetical protein NNJEOMEG_03866 [Fundidesulfovibrio magnetotacticus]